MPDKRDATVPLNQFIAMCKAWLTLAASEDKRNLLEALIFHFEEVADADQLINLKFAETDVEDLHQLITCAAQQHRPATGGSTGTAIDRVMGMLDHN